MHNISYLLACMDDDDDEGSCMHTLSQKKINCVFLKNIYGWCDSKYLFVLITIRID